MEPPRPQPCDNEQQRQDEDDGGAGRHLKAIAEHQASDVARHGHDGSHEGNPPERLREAVGNHHGNGQQRDEQHDAHDANREDDGHGDERRQQIGNHTRMDAAAAGEFAVEGDIHDRTQPQQRPRNQQSCQHGKRPDVAVGHRHDAAEKICRQVARGITRPQRHEERTDGHAHRPDDADGRILTDASPRRGPLDAQRREDGEEHRPENRIGPQIEGDAQSAERRMGDASRQKDHPPADDIGADDAAGDARKDAGDEGIREIAVLEQVAEKIHKRSKMPANLHLLPPENNSAKHKKRRRVPLDPTTCTMRRHSASEENGQACLQAAEPIELEEIDTQFEAAVAHADALAQVVGFGIAQIVSAAHLDVGREAPLEQVGLRVEEERHHHRGRGVIVAAVQLFSVNLENAETQTRIEMLSELPAMDGREGESVAPVVGRGRKVDVAALNHTPITRTALAELAAFRPDRFRLGNRHGLAERSAPAGLRPKRLRQHERRPHGIGTTHGIDGPDVLERSRTEASVACGESAHRKTMLHAEPVLIRFVTDFGLDQYVGRGIIENPGNQLLPLRLHGRRALEEVVRPGRIDLDPNGSDVKFGNVRYFCTTGSIRTC